MYYIDFTPDSTSNATRKKLSNLGEILLAKVLLVKTKSLLEMYVHCRLLQGSWNSGRGRQ